MLGFSGFYGFHHSTTAGLCVDDERCVFNLLIDFSANIARIRSNFSQKCSKWILRTWLSSCGKTAVLCSVFPNKDPCRTPDKTPHHCIIRYESDRLNCPETFFSLRWQDTATGRSGRCASPAVQISPTQKWSHPKPLPGTRKKPRISCGGLKMNMFLRFSSSEEIRSVWQRQLTLPWVGQTRTA